MSHTNAPISVVVPGLNEEKNIAKCLYGLLNQTVPPTEIIFVNHNSSDKTLDIVKLFKSNFKEKNINYTIITEKKKGIGNARNAGWYKATQPIIASTDADCIPSKNWIKNIHLFFKNNPKAVACAGKIIQYDGGELVKFITNQGNWYGVLNKYMHFRNGFVPMATGNCAVKKEVFKKSGGFSSEITSINGLDDVELASRIYEIGNIIYDKNVTVFTSFRRYSDIEKAIYSLLKRGKALKQIRKGYSKRRLKRIITKIEEIILENKSI